MSYQNCYRYQSQHNALGLINGRFIASTEQVYFQRTRKGYFFGIYFGRVWDFAPWVCLLVRHHAWCHLHEQGCCLHTSKSGVRSDQQCVVGVLGPRLCRNACQLNLHIPWELCGLISISVDLTEWLTWNLTRGSPNVFEADWHLDVKLGGSCSVTDAVRFTPENPRIWQFSTSECVNWTAFSSQRIRENIQESEKALGSRILGSRVREFSDGKM